MKNYIQPGNTLGFIATAALSSGQPTVIGSHFGVVCNDVANGEEGQLALTGVFELPKVAADNATQFEKAYWDESESKVTTTETDNVLIGTFATPAAADSTFAGIRLNGVSI